MILTDLQMAYASFKATKVRSLLTVLGIAIGVASIVLIYALGRGITETYASSSVKLGEKIVVVTPGKFVKKTESGNIEKIDFSALLGASNLTEKDIAAIKQTSGVIATAPITLLSGLAQTESTKDNTGTTVIGTNLDFKTITAQPIKFGSYFTAEDSGRNLAVIGKETAEVLFQEESPIGRMLNFRGTEFVVKGVFDEFKQAGTTIGVDYNNSVFIPLETAKKIGGGSLEIREIKILTNDEKPVDTVANSVKTTLLREHKNQEDFTIYKRDEYRNLTEELFSYVTTFVTAVAAISLFVGGIGIMNIMFVSVSERTKEIGIRKALGATTRQVLGHFLIEAIILSTIGGFLGILVALSGGYLIAIRTSLSPSFSPLLILLALVLSVVIGTIFGFAPAIKASRQDPIKSLRHH